MAEQDDVSDLFAIASLHRLDNSREEIRGERKCNARLFASLSLSASVRLQITVYVNKVGPYANPQETYHYYSLPVCRPEKVKRNEEKKKKKEKGVSSLDRLERFDSGRSSLW